MGGHARHLHAICMPPARFYTPPARHLHAPYTRLHTPARADSPPTCAYTHLHAPARRLRAPACTHTYTCMRRFSTPAWTYMNPFATSILLHAADTCLPAYCTLLHAPTHTCTRQTRRLHAPTCTHTPHARARACMHLHATLTHLHATTRHLHAHACSCAPLTRHLHAHAPAWTHSQQRRRAAATEPHRRLHLCENAAPRAAGPHEDACKLHPFGVRADAERRGRDDQMTARPEGWASQASLLCRITWNSTGCVARGRSSSRRAAAASLMAGDFYVIPPGILIASPLRKSRNPISCPLF